MKKVLVLFISALILSSCIRNVDDVLSKIDIKEITSFVNKENREGKLISLRITESDKKEGLLSVCTNLIVENKLSDITIKSAEIFFFTGGLSTKHFAKIELSDPVRIKKGLNDYLQVNVDVILNGGLLELLSVKGLMEDPSSMDKVTISGNVVLRKGIFVKKQRFEKIPVGEFLSMLDLQKILK